MARDIENVNITLPDNSDTIELIVDGEPTEVVITLEDWGHVTHADDADTVDGHTVARNVLADEYTNTQIDTALGLKQDKEEGKGLSSNDFTDALKTKLEGIEAGAQVNTLTGVKGSAESDYRTGNVEITKANIGLGNVDNTSDLNKPISTATQTALDGKVDKVTGKELSTNDFTDADKTKLDGIAAGAEVNVQADWNQTDSSADDYIKNKPSVTGAVWGSVTGTLSDQTDLQTALNGKVNTEAGKGLSTEDFTTAEKTKLAGIAAGAEVNVQANWTEADNTADSYIQNKPNLSAVATSGAASDVSYDNTGSGMSATKVQGAVDELSSGLASHTGDTVIHVTATDKANWNGKADDSVVVKSVNNITPTSGNVAVNAENIPAHGYGNESASGNPITITDGTPSTVKNLDVSLEPIQDLHGYDHPWPAGGGKNILPMTVAGIKAANTVGAWSGNTYTFNNVQFTIETDESGNVTGIKANGLASADALFSLGTNNLENYLTVGTSYSLNGCPAGGGDSTYRIMVRYYGYDNGGGITFTFSGASGVHSSVVIISGYNAQNLLFKPMIRLATKTDATFEPYSNICPISGYDSVSVQRREINQWDEETKTGYYNASTGAYVNVTGQLCSKNLTEVMPSTTYYFHKGTQEISGQVIFYDADGHYISYLTGNSFINRTFTTPANCHYLTINLGDQYGTTYNNDISINYPSTDTAYHAYQGNTATISLTQAGTVYGGTLDFDMGVLTVTDLPLIFDDSSWGFYESFFYKTVIQSGVNVPKYYTTENGVTIFLNGNNGQAQAYLADNPFLTSETDIGSMLNGYKLIYELNTPQTYQLTPAQLALLEGYNIITSNGTTISLDYYGSEATNVQAEIAEFETNIDRLTGSIAQIEESPATATHVLGTYLVYNSQLYKVISAIAVGENLSIGTNISPTTIMAELLALTA